MTASYVRPDGTAELSHDDLLTVLGAIDHACRWVSFVLARCQDCTSARFCGRHAGLGRAVAAYAALACRLGRD